MGSGGRPLWLDVPGDGLYRLVVFRIISRRNDTPDRRDGTPYEVELVKPGDALDISLGEDVMTAYVPDHMVKEW